MWERKIRGWSWTGYWEGFLAVMKWDNQGACGIIRKRCCVKNGFFTHMYCIDLDKPNETVFIYTLSSCHVDIGIGGTSQAPGIQLF